MIEIGQISIWDKLRAVPMIAGRLASTTKVAFKYTQVVEAVARGIKLYGSTLALSARALTRVDSVQGMISPTKNFLAAWKWMDSSARLVGDEQKDDYATCELTSEFVNDIANLTNLFVMTGFITLRGIFGTSFAIWSMGSYFAKEAFGFAKSYTVLDKEFAKDLVNENKMKQGEKISRTEYFVDSEEKKTLQIIKLVKNITAIASVAFAAYAFFTGVALISAQAVFWLGAVSVVMSLWSEFYKETMSANLRPKEIGQPAII